MGHKVKQRVPFRITLLCCKPIPSLPSGSALRWNTIQPNTACKPDNLENSNIEKLLALNQQLGKIIIKSTIGQDFTGPSCNCILYLVYNTYDLLFFIYVNE
jgi:hypothetical protein